MGVLLKFPDEGEERQPASLRRRAWGKTDDRTLADWAESWKLYLEDGKSPKTIALYIGAAAVLHSYMETIGVTPVLSNVTSDIINECLKAVAVRTSTSTADTRRRGLVQFFGWLVKVKQELRVEDNPMREVMPRKVVEKVIDPLPDEVVHALIKDTAGKGFRDRRDRAIIRVFLDSGGRLSEISNLKVEDVDLKLARLKVLGKGGRERYIPLGRKARQALDDYLWTRRTHPYVEFPELWLGPKGPLTPSGVYQGLKKRAARLGYKVRPHAFRHTFSHHFLANGGNEHALAHLNGWTSTQMVARYAKSTQGERARQEHKRLSPGDRF